MTATSARGLRPTHLGYAYQDLLTAIRLVDVVLGRATTVIVDTKMFDKDRFDDVTCEWREGRRERLQIKHTGQERELAPGSFTKDHRGLQLNLLIEAIDRDLRDHPGTSYRIAVRDLEPRDPAFTRVLRPVDNHSDPGPALPGLAGTRFRFSADALRVTDPWASMVEDVDDDTLERACAVLLVEAGLPDSSLDIRAPGPAEQVLLRRVADELGAGRPPNRHRTPEDVALALIEAAKAARSRKGTVTSEDLVPRLDLSVDFGAVHEGHPVDQLTEVPRPQALAGVVAAVTRAVAEGGPVLVTGGPGVGKSWLCEQLAHHLRDRYFVARHHCWLGPSDAQRDRRVLTEVVIGSLLGQLEAMAPAAVAEVRPRYAATRDTLAAALAAIRRDFPHKPIVLIVDGLDHITRVRGRVTGAAFHDVADPARVLVDTLCEEQFPEGVALVLASQPGDHLDPAEVLNAEGVAVPAMNRREVRRLAERLGVLAAVEATAAGELGRADAAVDLIHSRSRGNALYATYLCRQARGPGSALGTAESSQHSAAVDPIDRLSAVPVSANDLDEYYAYLLAGLAHDQRYAIGMLAVCDFAVTADELQEIFPWAAPILPAALAAVAPIVVQHPGAGGLKIHHESFSRFVRQESDSETWIAAVRTAAADWLKRRGFFTDTRAFRHLPELLALVGRDDELAALIAPDFLARAIAGLQPPAAIMHTLTFLARHSASRLDWPRLVQCVELRRAFDTYETDSLSGTVVHYSDVLVALLGADAVAASLLYDGLPTVSPRWGLRLCEAVDRAGVAAPWAAYLTAWEDTRDNDNTRYGAESDGQVFLAELRGRLRLRDHRDPDAEPETGDGARPIAIRIAHFLDQNRLSDIPRVLDVLVDCLGAEALCAGIPLIEKPSVRAAVLLCLADLSAAADHGLPSPRTLAVAAWACSSTVDPRHLLRLGVPLADISEEFLGRDIDATLCAATDEAMRYPGPTFAGAVRRWLTLLAVAHERDPQAPLRLLPQLEGAGFFRAWMRFAVATVGLRAQVDSGVLAPQAASTAVRVALHQLAEVADAFTGKPRACDLWDVNHLVREVIHDAVLLLGRADLEPAIASLTAISDETTTSLSGMTGTGPLITTDLLAMLSRTADRTGAAVVHQLMRQLRNEHTNRHTLYSENADFELEMARISLTAGDVEEARRCWEQAARYMAAYGSHKDITIHELLDSLPDLAAVDHQNTLKRLSRTQPLTYLVARHTDGRGTSSIPEQWWRTLAEIDPRSAARLASQVLLTEPGLPDSCVDAAHHRLLSVEATTADPVVLAAVRIAAGSGGRNSEADAALLRRLAELPPEDPARGAGALPLIANAITATYDDQTLTYAPGRPDSAMELRGAAQNLGGEGVSPQGDVADDDSRPRRSAATRATADYLVAQQRPLLPPGAAGAIAAVRDQAKRSYNDEPTEPRWSTDALTNAVGWRILEVLGQQGTDAAIRLLHRVADEIGPFGTAELLAEVAEGLALRRATAPDPLGRLAAIAHTLAFARIRGGGGWLTMAGRDRLELWHKAQALDADAAQQCLAHQVAETVASRYYGTIGVSQALVAALAGGGLHGVERPGVDDARACWDAAFSVIAFRLPGSVDLRAGAYRPGAEPVSRKEVDAALAQLAVSTLALPERSDRRRALLAATALLAARPVQAQTAVARVLAADLGAGPLSWLLAVVNHGVRGGYLSDDLADQLTTLARSDMLVVRAEAARILAAFGRPVPDPPVTDAHPALIRAVAADEVKDRT